ncbi:MAG: hypothetical protein ACRD0O_14695 [Acidimicrobiia bacterium]
MTPGVPAGADPAFAITPEFQERLRYPALDAAAKRAILGPDTTPSIPALGVQRRRRPLGVSESLHRAEVPGTLRLDGVREPDLPG